MPFQFLLVLTVALGSAIVVAQSPVYESQGKSGPVFSDQPSAGAKPLALPAPNVMQAPKLPPPEAPPPAAAPPPYRRLVVVSPVDQDTIHTNTGAFSLKVQVQPALRVRSGDSFLVRLDGNQLGQKYSTATINVTSAYWALAANPDNELHSLQVLIADQSGVVLIESAPVNFYARRATVRR